MDKLKCEYCLKCFVTKSNLKAHQKKAKYCLEMQRKLNVQVVANLKVCSYCKIECDPHNLKRHLVVCKAKKEHCSEVYEERIRFLEEKLKMMEIELSSANAKLEIFKADHDSLVDLAKQPRTTNNNTVNNKVLNMSILDLGKDRIQNIIETDLTYNHGAGGQAGIAEFVAEKVLIDDKGNSTFLCTDPARRVFKYRDSEGNVCKDIEARCLTDSLIKASLVENAVKVCREWGKNTDGSLDIGKTRFMEEKLSEIRRLGYDNTEFARELSVRTA